jgi:hypothetical protein
MFALTDDLLRIRILGCADGPASFNADATEFGARVVSIDPIYAFSQSEIASRIEATYPEMVKQTRQNHAQFVWTDISSVEQLGRLRMESMARFLDDYETGQKSGRYLAAELPSLPFADGAFDLALCSHLLVLYTEQLTLEFHVDSIAELCRVAKEVRLFPLLALNGVPSCHVRPVTESLEQRGLRITIETVAYEFQRGGNQMMRVVQQQQGATHLVRR